MYLVKRQCIFTPCKEHHSKDKERSHKIHQYTANDDTEALPHILATELPWLWFGWQIRS